MIKWRGFSCRIEKVLKDGWFKLRILDTVPYSVIGHKREMENYDKIYPF